MFWDSVFPIHNMGLQMPTAPVDQILKLCNHSKTVSYYTTLNEFLFHAHYEQNKEATDITGFSLF